MTNDALFTTVTERTMGLAKGILAYRGLDRDFRLEDGFADIGLTSLDLVNLMIAVESEFDLMIPSSFINPQNFHSVATIARVVVSLKSDICANEKARTK